MSLTLPSSSYSNSHCTHTHISFKLIDITDDGFLSLLTSDGSTKDDLKLPEDEIGQQIRTMFDDGKDVVISVVAAMNIEGVAAVKEAAAQK